MNLGEEVFAFGGGKAGEKGVNTASAHEETQLGGDFGRISDEFEVNCVLVDAIAGRALNLACLRL